jgi:hypothetical protein
VFHFLNPKEVALHGLFLLMDDDNTIRSQYFPWVGDSRLNRIEINVLLRDSKVYCLFDNSPS